MQKVIDVTPYLLDGPEPGTMESLNCPRRISSVTLILDKMEASYLQWIGGLNGNTSMVRALIRRAMGYKFPHWAKINVYRDKRNFFEDPPRIEFDNTTRDEDEIVLQPVLLDLAMTEDAFLDELALRWGLNRGEVICEMIRDGLAGKIRNWLLYPWPHVHGETYREDDTMEGRRELVARGELR